MKHSRIDYKNDIKVLGRVISIATENKVAEAEQIFDTTFKYGDSPEGMNQYDINRLLKEAITNVQGNVTNLTEIQNKVAEIPALKSDVNNLKSRVSTLEGKVNTLESDVSELKSCCREVQNILENLPTGAGDAYFTVSPKSVELNVGDIANLSLELGSDLNGSFQFNGYSNIISVDSNGKITALAAGETDITVSVTGYVPTQTVHVIVIDNTPDEPTPQPVSWVLNVSPASVSADVNEEFTITATDGTTNGGMNDIMVPSIPTGLTLISAQSAGTNPLSKQFTFSGSVADSYTIAFVGMADDIEVTREQVNIVISDVETPEIPEVEYTIEARPDSFTLQANGDYGLGNFYLLKDGTEVNENWSCMILEQGQNHKHGTGAIEFIVNPESQSDAPDGKVYTVYGIVGTDEQILDDTGHEWLHWTVEDWNNTTLPKASTTFTAITNPPYEVPEDKYVVEYRSHNSSYVYTTQEYEAGETIVPLTYEEVFGDWAPDGYEFVRWTGFPANMIMPAETVIVRPEYQLAGYDVTFAYDPSIAGGNKIVSYDDQSAEEFSYQSSGDPLLYYGSFYGLNKDTKLDRGDSRTYTLHIADGYNFTGIDWKMPYDVILTEEQKARMGTHISYNISSDGKTITITVTDDVNGDTIENGAFWHYDIILLYEAA